MKTTFIHTADWQLGKPFRGVEDDQKRAILQNERMEVVRRMGKIAIDKKASFVLVAGDLFDSSTATKATVSAACSAIGSIGIPVYVIPGNHDHGGPGGIWDQEFYLREQKELAPNLHILLKSEPLELDNAVLFPCPLLRRHESVDTTAWVRNLDLTRFDSKPLILLAHGSIQGFGAFGDDEEAEGGAINEIDLDRLPNGIFDYIALGDWHGTKEIQKEIWYSGTPEPDRFPKSEDHQQGNILVVNAGKNETSEVEIVSAGCMKWHVEEFYFHDDSGISILKQKLTDCMGTTTNRDLIKLSIEGSLGLGAYSEMEELLDSMKARLIRLKLVNQVTISPSEDEIISLTRRANDPLLSSVASKLVETAKLENADAVIARIALRELYTACLTK